MSGRLILGSKTVNTTGDFARQTVEMPGPLKRVISIGADSVMMPLALWAALSLKTGSPLFSMTDWPAYLAVVAISTPIFVRLGLYRAVIRFLGHKAVFAVAFAVLLSGVLLGLLGQWLAIPALSWSVVTIYSCLALLYVAGSRFVVRYYLLTHYIQPTVARVAIYGAGDAGAGLSTALLTTRAFDPLVFVDDKKSLQGRMVNGIKVYAPEQLPQLIKDRNIDRILLALPSLTRRRRREILSGLEPLGVHVQTVPEFEQLVTGTAAVADIREVDVCDLLGRDSVPPQAGLFDAWGPAAPSARSSAARSSAWPRSGWSCSKCPNWPSTTFNANCRLLPPNTPWPSTWSG